MSSSDGKIVVYNSGTGRVRDNEEMSLCFGWDGGGSSYFTIDIIEIPIDNPSKSKIVKSPAVFTDIETGNVAGLWRGGDHGDETQDTKPTDQCHDITVFPSANIAAGACSGNGILFDIKDPYNPKRLDVVTDVGFAYWHSATFNNDGNLWLYFGTGNTQKLQEQSNLVENRIYGIKDLDFPRFQQISKNTVQYCTNSSCPTSKQGWYVNLTNSRKLTAEPTIDRDRVYFPLYEPTTGTNACKTGKAILTGYDALCGKSVLTVEVGTGVLSKVIVRKDKLYVGISGEAKKNVSGFTQKDNLLSTTSGAQSTGKQVQVEFWKENY